MKQSHTVYWTGTAQFDIRSIIEYISLDSPENAKKILKQLRSEGDKLKKFPEKGRVVPELLENNIHSYKEIFFKPWRIIYKIESNSVYIVSVIDGRRNLEDVLLNRIMSK